jgi:LPLT family lysophospholipid transporter-like MFS transporter
VTTLMWGGAVTLQLLVLKWADVNLGLSLSKAAVMQGITGLGIAVGAAGAATLVPLRSSLKVLPIGIITGAVAIGMAFYSKGLFPPGMGIRVGPFVAPIYIVLAYPLMILLGALSGFFIVPMNALLQHRGATLLSAGHSIAVQNFNQNLAVLLMLGLYAMLLTAKLPVPWIIVVFGTFITFMMWMAKRRSMSNARTFDMRAMLEE